MNRLGSWFGETQRNGRFESSDVFAQGTDRMGGRGRRHRCLMLLMHWLVVVVVLVTGPKICPYFKATV